MPEQSKAERIAEVQSNLPLPEDPPVASDWNSLDERNVNVKAGERQVFKTPVSHAINELTYFVQAELPSGRDDLTEPQTKGSGVREEDGKDLSGAGRQGKEGLDGLPKDAKSN
jgi:hypothetical protein